MRVELREDQMLVACFQKLFVAVVVLVQLGFLDVAKPQAYWLLYSWVSGILFAVWVKALWQWVLQTLVGD